MGKYCELIMKAVDKGMGDEAWGLAEETMAKISRKDPALYTSIMDQLEQLA